MSTKSKAVAVALTYAMWFFSVLFAPAQAAEPAVVKMGWYGSPRIWVIAKASGLFEKNMNTEIQWLQFPSGAAALTALASRQVDIIRMGSSPTVAGIARKLPIDVIAVAELISTSERLIARKPIRTISDLKGKRVAYPPGSTAHYALMAALKVNNVAAADLTLLSMDPADMLAAWRRGDIDAAYVWGPFTQSMEAAGGTEILTTEQLQKDGYSIFNTYVVRKEFAEQYPEQVVAFLKTFQQANDMYRNDKEAMIKLVAKHLDQDEDQVRSTLEGLSTPGYAEQIAMLGDGGVVASAMADTARFLADLGEMRARDVPASFDPAIDPSFMKRAAQ